MNIFIQEVSESMNAQSINTVALCLKCEENNRFQDITLTQVFYMLSIDMNLFLIEMIEMKSIIIKIKESSTFKE
jgi:hypothetical protein